MRYFVPCAFSTPKLLGETSVTGEASVTVGDRKLEILFQILKKKVLYFCSSKTTSGTKIFFIRSFLEAQNLWNKYFMRFIIMVYRV